MTYSERLKHLNSIANLKLNEYRDIRREIHLRLGDGIPVTGEMLAEQQERFEEFQAALNAYKNLLAHVISQRVPFDSDFLGV